MRTSVPPPAGFAALMLWYTGHPPSTASGARRCRFFHSLWMDTMNRCIESRGRAALLACALLAGLTLFPNLPAAAQGFAREAPKDVVLGRLVVTAPPQVTMNGKPDQLSPGARIRDLNNMLLMSGSVVGQDLPVVYRRDAAGLIHEAWLLTPAEYDKLAGAGSLTGYQRFNQLLAIIFGGRP
jgi:hypothetical protein